MVGRGQPPPGYYSATTAKKKLGHISDGMLRSYVQQGKIQRFVPPERKQGFYRKEDVDRIARALQAFYGTLPGEIRFQRATEREDVVECARIAREVYGGEGISVETGLTWMQNHPEILYVLKSDRIAGYAYVLPLRRASIDALLQGEMHLADLTAEDIERFEPGKPLDLYLLSMAVKPGGGREERRVLASQLISGLIHILLEWGGRGIVIRSLAARSCFAGGIRILSEMGFRPYPLPREPEERCSCFILEVEPSHVPFIRRYKRALGQAQGGKANGSD